MKKIQGLIIWSIMILNCCGYAQVLNRARLRVIISPKLFRVDSVFSYQYKITNEISSQQRLDELNLEVGDAEEIRNGTLQSFVEPQDWSGWFSDRTALPKDSSALGTLVWVASDSASNNALLMIPALSSIAPGDSMRISFESKGLPTVKRFWGRGWATPLSEHEYDSLIAVGLTKNDIMRPWYEDAYGGLTISPQLPSAIFQHLNLLDTLLSYTRQSAALGWLGRNRDDDCDDDERPDDGVVRNIENRLQKARRELVRGDSVKARRELVKLVRKVDRLQRRGERVMTSEAYALLKYNTEYLIERLPERRRR